MEELSDTQLELIGHKFGVVLREIREKELDLTLEEFGERTDTPPRYIRMIENGGQIPQIELIEFIVNFLLEFEVSLDRVFKRVEGRIDGAELRKRIVETRKLAKLADQLLEVHENAQIVVDILGLEPPED